MTNPQKPDVDDLLKKLQADRAESPSDAHDDDRGEVAPGLIKKFAQVGKPLGSAMDESADQSNPDGEALYAEHLQAPPEELIAAYPEFSELELVTAKQGLFARLREKLSRIADPLNHEGIVGEVTEAANWPRQIQVGFMTEVKKKDMLRYIGEWVSDNATSKSACFYQIQPYNGGLAYEIQEGGSGSGVLKSAMETLSRHSEVIIPSSERYLQLSIKPTGFSSYLLDEFETKVPSPELVFKDPLKPVFSRHHGLMVSGLLSALLGVAIIGAAWFMVYGVYNKDKVPVYAKVHYELPSAQLRKVNDVLNQPNSYLDRLEYRGDKWNLIIKKSDLISAPIPVPNIDPVPAVDPALIDIQKTLKEAGK